MTVAGLLATIAMAALLTGMSTVGHKAHQSPPSWAWFVLAAVLSLAAVEAGRRAVLDRRRLRSEFQRVSRREA